jgi:hypothetical protein
MTIAFGGLSIVVIIGVIVHTWAGRIERREAKHQ